MNFRTLLSFNNWFFYWQKIALLILLGVVVGLVLLFMYLLRAHTYLAYLGYVHYRLQPSHRPRRALWIVIGAFLLLQITWWDINYLPSAQGSSVHTYSAAAR